MAVHARCVQGKERGRVIVLVMMLSTSTPTWQGESSVKGKREVMWKGGVTLNATCHTSCGARREGGPPCLASRACHDDLQVINSRKGRKRWNAVHDSKVHCTI